MGALVTADVVPDEITQNLNDNEDAVTNVMASTTTSATTLAVATSTPATLAPVKRIDVLAIGDSVMLGAARKLKAKGITVDAEKIGSSTSHSKYLGISKQPENLETT